MATFRGNPLPLTGASNAENMKNRDFRPLSRVIFIFIQHIVVAIVVAIHLNISEIIQNRAVIAMECK